MDTALPDAMPPDLAAEAHGSVVRQIETWLGWMDHVLEAHRLLYVYRNAGAYVGLSHHEKGFKMALRYSHFAYAVISDPDFNEPVLLRRLKVRIQKLQDAYDTFHDAEVTDQKADRILAEVFPLG